MSKSNQQHFFDNIIHWQQSGLSQKAWCEQNNMAYSVFHYWYRRFRNQKRANEADAKGRHLLKNMGDALQKLLERKRQELKRNNRPLKPIIVTNDPAAIIKRNTRDQSRRQ